MSTLVRGLSGRGGPLRYAGAGLVNSAAGYGVILALAAIGTNPFVANAAGFAAGFLVSLILAQRWTFGPAKRAAAPIRYGAAFLLCYATNIGLVAAGLGVGVPSAFAQAIGVGAYAVTFYLACRWWVFGSNTQIRSDSLLAWQTARARPGLMATLLSIPIGILVSFSANPSDVVWQMWIARQLNGGADLYTGIVEINPPLWFWAAMPLDHLAAIAGASPLFVVNVATAAIGVAAIGLCAQLTEGWEDEANGLADRFIVLGTAIFALLLFPTLHFAQREHIALIGALPYLLLVTRRAEGRDVAFGTALSVGLLAALGLALKHYFVLLPIIAEAWRVWRGGRIASVIRTETVVLGLCAAAYACSVLLFSRDFLDEMVPLVALAYDGYETGLLSVLGAPFSLISLMIGGVALVAVARLPSGDNRRWRIEALLCGLFVFFLAYTLQSKGFLYHLIPVVGLAAMIGGLLLRRLPDPRLRCALGAMLGSLVLLGVLEDPDHELSERTYDYDAAGIRDGTPVLVLSSVASLSLPALEARGAVWTSRSLGVWPLVSAAMATEKGQRAKAAEIIDRIANEIAEDAACNPPDVILADTLLADSFPAFEADVIGVLREHPASAEVMAAFTVAETRGQLITLKRTGDLPPPANAVGCRTIH